MCDKVSLKRLNTRINAFPRIEESTLKILYGYTWTEKDYEAALLFEMKTSKFGKSERIITTFCWLTATRI